MLFAPAASGSVLAIADNERVISRFLILLTGFGDLLSSSFFSNASFRANTMDLRFSFISSGDKFLLSAFSLEVASLLGVSELFGVNLLLRGIFFLLEDEESDLSDRSSDPSFSEEFSFFSSFKSNFFDKSGALVVKLLFRRMAAVLGVSGGVLLPPSLACFPLSWEDRFLTAILPGKIDLRFLFLSESEPGEETGDSSMAGKSSPDPSMDESVSSAVASCFFVLRIKLSLDMPVERGTCW